MEDEIAFPTSDVEIGARLKQLRGRRSLRELALAAKVSKSSLSRYESGATPIPFALARSIDQAYGAEGWIEAAVASVGRGRWKPWTDGAHPQREFFHQWPAQYVGLVWVLIRPVAVRAGTPHDVRLQWGPWTYEETLESLHSDGTSLLTGKAQDEVPVTCNLQCSQAVHALWGIGEELPASTIMDIRQRWHG